MTHFDLSTSYPAWSGSDFPSKTLLAVSWAAPPFHSRCDEYTSVLDNISCLILHNRNLLQRVLGTAAGSDNQFQATSVGEPGVV